MTNNPVYAMKGIFLSLLMVWLLLCPNVSHGYLRIRQYNEARHDRFYTGSDKSFIGDPYDFSGVGLSSTNNWGTLLNDNCFISAMHLHPAAGATITFWATNDPAGPSYTYTVTGGTRVGTTDLWIGWFDTAVTVDSSIARYPVLMMPYYKNYYDMILYNYGVSNRVGRNVLDGFVMVSDGTSTGVTAEYDYDNDDSPSVGGDETFIQPGDSGAPSFTVIHSRLALIGVHWAIDTNPEISYDSFVPSYYNEINTILAQRGQSLAMVVPEPGLFSYMLVTSGWLWIQRRRRSIS